MVSEYFHNGLFKKLAVFLALTIICFIVGLSVAIGFHKALIAIFAVLGGIFLLLLPTKYILTTLFIISFFIVGQLVYFLKVDSANWIPFLLALILYLRVISAYYQDPFTRNSSSSDITLTVFIFFFVAICSSIVNAAPLMQVIIGFKHSLFFWSIFFLIAFSAVSIGYIERLWSFIKWLIIFQVPIVLYQAFVIVPKRISAGGYDASHWDAIVGGFGGNQLSGGASSALALFIVVGLVYFTSQKKRKLISNGKYFMLVFLSLLSIGFAEVKIIFILIPLALLLLFRDVLIRKPLYFLGASMLVLVVLSTIFVGYTYQKTGNIDDSFNMEYFYEQTFEHQLDSSHARESTGEIGRLTSIVHWWSENGLERPDKMLFGYGSGSSRVTGMAVGTVASKYYYYTNFGRSTATQLLWEYGLIGLFLFVYILIRSSYVSYRLTSHKAFTPNQQSIIETTFISLMLLIITMVHSRDIVQIPASVLFTVFLVGSTVFWSKYVKNLESLGEKK